MNSNLLHVNIGQPPTGTKRKQANKGGVPSRKTKLNEPKLQDIPPKVGL